MTRLVNPFLQSTDITSSETMLATNSSNDVDPTVTNTRFSIPFNNISNFRKYNKIKELLAINKFQFVYIHASM